MLINDKIKQVLTIKNLSPSYLADDIGVQRSSISHILSGRNRPSLDIIQKIVRRFPEFSYDWFLEDDTQLSTDELLPSDQKSGRDTRLKTQLPKSTPDPSPSAPVDRQSVAGTDSNGISSPKQAAESKPTTAIDRILIFYTDGTFREYRLA